jgi:hypothetical protein
MEALPFLCQTKQWQDLGNWQIPFIENISRHLKGESGIVKPITD